MQCRVSALVPSSIMNARGIMGSAAFACTCTAKQGRLTQSVNFQDSSMRLYFTAALPELRLAFVLRRAAYSLARRFVNRTANSEIRGS